MRRRKGFREGLQWVEEGFDVVQGFAGEGRMRGGMKSPKSHTLRVLYAQYRPKCHLGADVMSSPTVKKDGWT